MTLRPQALWILLYLPLLFGCSFTHMETANQLADDERVFAASLDNIGYGPIPRLSFSLLQGISDAGDFGIHGGTTVFTANAGLSGRYYLTDRLNLGLQTDFMGVLFHLPFVDNVFDGGILSVTPRLTTATKEGEFFYAGVQSLVLTGFDLRGDGSTSLLAALGGIVLGIDFGSRSDGGGFQVELIYYPFGYREGDIGHTFDDLDRPTPILGQISFGTYFY